MYRKVRVRKNEERIGQDVSAKQREQRNRIRTIQQREDQNLLYSQNFYLFGDAFLGRIFLRKNREEFFARGKFARKFETIRKFGNCCKRGLIKTIRGRRARFSALFPYLRTGRTLSVDRACCAKRARKWKHWHGGKRENDSNLVENGGGYRER